MNIWQAFLYQPILNLLLFFYQVLFQNLGLAIIALTAFVRGLTLPLVLPSLKMAQKQKDLAPHLDKLKKKYNHDKKRLAEEQMRLFQKEGINPAAGCLPQILQLVILIALYQAFIEVLRANTINTHFLYLDLAQKDPLYILPVLAGVAQFALSKMMVPQKPKAGKQDDVMGEMQSQMAYLMPLMTVFIGASLPSGLALYWLTTMIFSLVQQWWVNRDKLS